MTSICILQINNTCPTDFFVKCSSVWTFTVYKFIVKANVMFSLCFFNFLVVIFSIDFLKYIYIYSYLGTLSTYLQYLKLNYLQHIVNDLLYRSAGSLINKLVTNFN